MKHTNVKTYKVLKVENINELDKTCVLCNRKINKDKGFRLYISKKNHPFKSIDAKAVFHKKCSMTQEFLSSVKQSNFSVAFLSI